MPQVNRLILLMIGGAAIAASSAMAQDHINAEQLSAKHRAAIAELGEEWLRARSPDGVDFDNGGDLWITIPSYDEDTHYAMLARDVKAAELSVSDARVWIVGWNEGPKSMLPTHEVRMWMSFDCFSPYYSIKAVVGYDEDGQIVQADENSPGAAVNRRLAVPGSQIYKWRSVACGKRVR